MHLTYSTSYNACHHLFVSSRDDLSTKRIAVSKKIGDLSQSSYLSSSCLFGSKWIARSLSPKPNQAGSPIFFSLSQALKGITFDTPSAFLIKYVGKPINYSVNVGAYI